MIPRFENLPIIILLWSRENRKILYTNWNGALISEMFRKKNKKLFLKEVEQLQKWICQTDTSGKCNSRTPQKLINRDGKFLKRCSDWCLLRKKKKTDKGRTLVNKIPKS